MRILIKPSISTFGVVLLWLLLRWLGVEWTFKEDDDLFSSGTIATLGIFYSFVAVFILNKVWGQLIDSQNAVSAKDSETFFRIQETRIPGTIKLVLLIFSFFLVGAFFLANFKSFLGGLYSVSVITFILALHWEVMIDLDDPIKGVWNVERIPEKWLEELKKRNGLQ